MHSYGNLAEVCLTVDNDNASKGQRTWTRIGNVATVRFIFHDYPAPTPDSVPI